MRHPSDARPLAGRGLSKERRLTALGLCGIVAAAALGATSSVEGRRLSRAAGTQVFMRHVVMFPFDNAPGTIERLNGTAVPTRPGHPINMDDTTSYAIRVRHAEMIVPAATMEALMNQYILPNADTAIKRVSITFGNGVILMRGTMQKGVPIGFTAQAVASPAPDGEMRIAVIKMKTAGVVPKGVMDALGLRMSKVAQPNNQQVFRIVGDTMIMPVSSMFPPPKFFGPLRSVRVTPQGMIAVIGAGRAGSPRGPNAEPYLRMQGGRVHFAKLTMGPTDLTMIPKTRAPTLGFSPAHYYRQLLAGYSTNQPDGGLVGHVADYRGLGRR